MDHGIEGVCKFQQDIFPQSQEFFKQLVEGQNPEVLFITCANSRVVPHLITQTRPGDLFICRNAGNMLPPYGELQGGVSATIEYAVDELGVGHIAARLASNTVQLHAWVYDIGTGHVTFWDQAAERFIPIEQYRSSTRADVAAEEAYANLS